MSGSDIRSARVARWQTESSKRSTWADKHPESKANNLIDQIANEPTAPNKGFMDHVRDFNNTVESLVIKPTLAMGNSIIQDVNTLIYNDNVGAKLFAAGNLALDSTMLFGLPEVGIAKATSVLSKFGFWGNEVKSFSFKIGEDITHFEKHGFEIAKQYNLGMDFNLKQYVQDANLIIKEGIFALEVNAYVKIPSNSGNAYAPFVDLDRVTNEITTFHLKSISFFERNVPSLGWSAKPKSDMIDIIDPNRELGWKSPYRTSL